MVVSIYIYIYIYICYSHHARPVVQYIEIAIFFNNRFHPISWGRHSIYDVLRLQVSDTDHSLKATCIRKKNRIDRKDRVGGGSVGFVIHSSVSGGVRNPIDFRHPAMYTLISHHSFADTIIGATRHITLV